ncbi:hypothetical protein TRIATDRAFT_290197 [Trichoderma atroviride IMI 206040]|uniref:Zn(2)-C6 fungal-type domain-containing protein n=1 Tax=Hypocrea atroviridis (strain ATCC 20476 / IMI 206040) TaxID=452589 RepID=G9NKZ2_HYPAI|nr:uncharacterized protein TRIATDRAFT_290197 [Trichoderma atroviride IMI 206040]EHK48562.1 hypothetical protein TRIATDRAFT_290197 [Trichoderma atroviride IMI 206040]
MPRRSRGCRACRQRRIGCDGGQPSCLQCLITNRTCSGPIQGPIILDQTRLVTARYQKALERSRLRRDVSVPIVKQPSSQAFASLEFISQFVSFISSNRQGPSKRPWLYALGIVSSGDNGLILEAALRAAATAFCGVMFQSYTLLLEASRLYGQALSRYVAVLSGGSGVTVTFKMCTTVLLSLYEAIWSTNPPAYFVHLEACWQMLVSADPKSEDVAVLRGVAAHVIHQTVSFCNVWAVVSRITTDQEEPLVNRLVLEIFTLQKLLSQSRSPNDDIIACAHDVNGRIENMWADYKAEVSRHDGQILLSSCSTRPYYDAFSALTVACFSAARILLSKVHSLSVRCPSADSLETTNGQVILECHSYLLPKNIGCAYLRMFLPLTVVALYSPSLRQSNLAHSTLNDSLRKPFSGLSSMAVERIRAS